MHNNSFEEELIDWMVEFLCTGHGEQELREITEKAIKLSNGEPTI